MKHKLLDWGEYQILRSDLAKYINTLLNHQPEKDLTNDEINWININIQNIMGIQTSKDPSNMFYRKINLVGKTIDSKSSKLYLLDPSTMPRKNIIDSIFSWVEDGAIYCGDKYLNSAMIGLSKEDKEEYKIILHKSRFDKRIPKLEYDVDYTDYLSEM
jgi:hypothetical protein